MQKKHYVGIFILLLVIPTFFLMRSIVSMEVVYILAALEALIGVSVLQIKDEYISAKRFWLLIIILIIIGIFTIAIFISFPIWIRIIFN